MNSTVTDFSAKEPSLGYYYQIRYSLYLLLKNKDKENPIIKIENLDDIVVEGTNSVDLYQTKLHINSVANLSNASVDLWKTIRVWSEGIISGQIDLSSTIFTLITTAPTSPDSIPFLLSANNKEKRDIKDIRIKLLEVAGTSDNRTNAAAYKSFQALAKDQQDKLIANILILDSALDIEETLKAVKSELRYSTTPNNLDGFLERLEGWWFQQCLKILRKEIDGISQKDLQYKIYDINDQFKSDNLPDDFPDPLDIKEEELESFEEKIFVKQLKLIAITSTPLRNAISDFRRAFEQRSRWLREELLNPREEELFEKRLFDHWKNIFDIIKCDCDGLTPENVEKIGREFYLSHFVKKTPPIQIRSKFTSEYLTRGSCHILSDSKKIGWHPFYDDKLK